MEYGVSRESVNWPEFPKDLSRDLESNFGARLVPLIAAIAAKEANKVVTPVELEFPLTSALCLTLSILNQVASDYEN